MQSREKNVLTLIYPRVPSERRVLLGLKKRGFGAGKYNGFGGKLEPGETLEQSAARELVEESALRAAPEDLRWCGTLTYIYDTKPKPLEVNVFDLTRWEGEPQESDEMKPMWFDHDSIPLKEMWADDDYWLVQYLDGHLALPFRARFRFKGHEGTDSWVVLESAVWSLTPAASLSEHGISCAGGGVPAPGAALVVSTVHFARAPEGSTRPLESFVRYHLQKGFVRLLIFVDDPDDEVSLDALRRFPCERVLVRVRSAGLLEEQRARCASFPELGAPELFNKEVSARQMLDAELAMALAPSLGCSWVVCLDSDELFFTQESSVVPHFERLAADGVDQMTYLNHEGVPEVAETPDYFATTTLFRRHHFVVPLSNQARLGLRFWMDRSKRGQYLLFYDNGKSACHTGIPGAKPRSQHLWSLPAGRKSCTALADARRLDVEGFRACEDPCILHFPVCGLGWLQSKYRVLGHFPDAWLGKVNVPVSFHSDCRDAASADAEAATSGSDGGGRMEDLFRREVLLDDAAEAARQISCGSCMRVDAHALLLDAVPSSASTTPATAPPAAEAAIGAGASRVADVTTTGVRGDGAEVGGGGLQGIERGWILSKSMGYL